MNAADKAKEVFASLKSSPWVPSFPEVILFTAAFVLIVIMIRLIHYTSIRKEVKEESRCLREAKSKQSGQYVISARNAANDDLYRVAYDMKAQTYNLECACKAGDVANNFEHIKIYDFKNPETPIITNKMCSCDTTLPSSRTYYSGTPGLVRFQTSGDTSFFSGTNV